MFYISMGGIRGPVTAIRIFPRVLESNIALNILLSHVSMV